MLENVQVRSISFNGQTSVYNELTEPAILFDNKTFVLHKIHEKNVIAQLFQEWSDAYQKAGFPQMANSLAWMEIPKHQELIDKIFNNTGYIEIFLNENKITI